MPSPALSTSRQRPLEGVFSIEPAGYLTASLMDARRVCASQGGFLFRMGHFFLGGEYEEALNWGWSPERKDGHG